MAYFFGISELTRENYGFIGQDNRPPGFDLNSVVGQTDQLYW
jgi:hypothetical protein